jgi:hypothetical protein
MKPLKFLYNAIKIIKWSMLLYLLTIPWEIWHLRNIATQPAKISGQVSGESHFWNKDKLFGLHYYLFSVSDSEDIDQLYISVNGGTMTSKRPTEIDDFKQIGENAMIPTKSLALILPSSQKEAIQLALVESIKGLAKVLFLFIILHFGERIVKELYQDFTFSSRIVSGIRGVGLGVIGLQSSLFLFEYYFYYLIDRKVDLVSQSFNIVIPSASPNLLTILIGLLLIASSKIFKEGLEMKLDQEYTV